MSTWFREENKKSWAQSLCENVLKCGPIPPHVAVIMDGNRRFAEKNNFKRSVGHQLGFNKLTETLEWCLALGVTEVTLYAFSIENFKRSKEEIDSLMELARQKFSSLLSEKELIDRHGLCLRIIGNMDYLPEDLQKLFAEGILATKHNNKAFLNICCPYTSREEMTQATKRLARGVQMGIIEEGDIDEELFSNCLYTRKSPEPDIIIRTSGEVRLSDFLLWQSSYSVLAFSRVLWPEFTHWHFYQGIIFYQQNFKSVQKAKTERDEKRKAVQMEKDSTEAKRRFSKTSNQVKSENETSNAVADSLTSDPEFVSLLERVSSERLKRVANFLNFIEVDYDQYISSLVNKDDKPSAYETICKPSGDDNDDERKKTADIVA